MITSSRHPLYSEDDIYKYRLTYRGGREFVLKYLEKFDTREDADDFERRKKLTYCPALAKEGLNEIRGGICQRMNEITRKGGTESYQQAVTGLAGGVDLEGSSMNTFINQKVLLELMIMGRVGVYVDMPAFNPYSTLAEFQKQPRPYLYYYCAEDILNWNLQTYENELITTRVLLRERQYEYNDYGLPKSQKELFRLLVLRDGYVELTYLETYVDPEAKSPNKLKERIVKQYNLDIPRIPFRLLDIGNSLLTDICDYQIGLLNLSSSDLNYLLRANFPFYVEPYDPKTRDIYRRQGAQATMDADGNIKEATESAASKPQETPIGVHHGRLYPLGADAPSFIHPSPDPLLASMKKQDQMKEEIRQLLNLNVSNVSTQRASAESKMLDQQGLESGMAVIGLELQSAERDIAEFWANYEKHNIEKLSISYPTTYTLKTDAERQEEAKNLKELKGVAPSKTFQKIVSAQAARILIEGKVSQEEFDKIMSEIKAAGYTTSDCEEIEKDLKNGLVSEETASDARGYDGKKEVPKAREQHAERLALIASSQAQGPTGSSNIANGEARGVKDLSAKSGGAEKEKQTSQNQDTKPRSDPLTRGKGK
jgi:hypothetical protein